MRNLSEFPDRVCRDVKVPRPIIHAARTADDDRYYTACGRMLWRPIVRVGVPQAGLRCRRCLKAVGMEPR